MLLILQNVWSSIIDWCGTQWVTPSSISGVFHWWHNHNLKPLASKIWACIPLAVLWSFWKMRNEFIFQNTPLNWAEVIELIKIRVTFWVKAAGLTDYSFIDITLNLKSILHPP